MPQMVRVISSNVAAVGYDTHSSVLFVRFIRGNRLYHYRGVAAPVYQALLVASSKGRFINYCVKPNYFGERIAQLDPADPD